MRVLQVISLGYVAGGAENVVVLQKDKLQARGHQTRVLSSDKGPAEGRFADYVYPHIKPAGPGKFLKHLWNSQSHRALQEAIADFQPDIVHFHTMGDLSPSVLYALGGRPAVMTVHGPEEYTLSMIEWTLAPSYFKAGKPGKGNLNRKGRLAAGYHRYLQRPVYLRGLKQVSLMLAPSRYIAGQVAQDKLGVPLQPLFNGIVLPDYQPLKNRNRILFVGRLERVKGVKYLLDALASLSKDRPELELHIAGDGEDRPHLEQQVKDLDLEDKVKFLGWVDMSQRFDLYRDATVLAIPSVWPENLPTVCIESLAVGRPVVGTDTGGFPEMVTDGQTGVVVPPADAAALARGLAYFLDHPAIEAVTRACAEEAKKFSLDTYVDKLEAIYRQAIDDAPGEPKVSSGRRPR